MQIQHRRERSQVHRDKSCRGKSDNEVNIKKTEFEFMLKSKTLISETAIDPELTRVRCSMRREDREAASDGYKPVFEKLSI